MDQELGLTTYDAIGLAYASFNQVKLSGELGYDRDVRHPKWTDELLDGLGRPDDAAYNVAVTGSKGKGSHAILLAAILQQLGFRVGLFTGPHLVNFMERLRVDGRVISESSFIAYAQSVHAVVETLPIPQGQYLGPVGFLAAIAALWFRDQGTEVNIYECGRGARHDDVNRILHRGSVLTPIFLEHPQQLGPTQRDVAWEKAGVITSQTEWVCCAPQSDEVMHVLRRESVGKRVQFRVCHEHYTYEVTSADEGTSVDEVKMTIHDGQNTCTLLLPSDSPYLPNNAAVAFDAALQVWATKRPGAVLPPVIDLRNVALPGRMQVISTAPLVVVDGTIHGDSADYVRQWLIHQQATRPVRQTILLIGLPSDKDNTGVLSAFAGIVNQIYLAKAHNPHLVFDDKVQQIAESYFAVVHTVSYIEDALNVLTKTLTSDDLLLILGTQSFVGDALKYFNVDTRTLWREMPAKG